MTEFYEYHPIYSGWIVFILKPEWIKRRTDKNQGDQFATINIQDPGLVQAPHDMYFPYKQCEAQTNPNSSYAPSKLCVPEPRQYTTS